VLGALMNSAEDLTARARAGDDEAFRLLFERYACPVLHFIYDLINQRELAEDLTQETFVRAYKNLRALRSGTKFSTWLFGIARNVAREALRSRRREQNSDFAERETRLKQQSDPGCLPDEQLLQKEFNVAMESALRMLNEDHRLVFILRILQHCSYEEIVAITGFSLAKVKTDLHRARLEMRRRIGPYLETR